MKILVCLSKTPDTTAKIAFTDNNRKFVTDGVQWILNPYDEWYALVRAIELKEKDPSVILHLIMIGPPGAGKSMVAKRPLKTGHHRALNLSLTGKPNVFSTPPSNSDISFEIRKS